MWWRQKTLARLHEEMSTIEMLERDYHYTPDPDPARSRAHESRQIRRSQIVDEISKRSDCKLVCWNRAWMGGSVLLLCAGGSAALWYLLS